MNFAARGIAEYPTASVAQERVRRVQDRALIHCHLVSRGDPCWPRRQGICRNERVTEVPRGEAGDGDAGVWARAARAGGGGRGLRPHGRRGAGGCDRERLG